MTLEPASQAVVSIGGNILTINGSLAATVSSGGIFNQNAGGVVVMNAPGAATISGLVFAPVTIGPTSCGSTAYTVNGLFSATGLIVNCPLDLGAQTVGVTGNLLTAGTGTITMAQPNAGLTVSGNAIFSGGSEAGFMSAGVILIGGNLTMTNSNQFNPSGNQQLVFNGPGAHTFSVLATGGGASIANLTVLAGTSLTFAGSTPLNITMTGSLLQEGQLIIPANTFFSATNTSSTLGTFTFVGATDVQGSLTLSGGAVFTNLSSTAGTGGMTVALPCSKSAGAFVGVTGTPPFNGLTCTQTP